MEPVRNVYERRTMPAYRYFYLLQLVGVGMFRKRRALDPLVVDPIAAQSSIGPQDNLPGPSAPSLETIAHSAGDSEALLAARWGVPLSHAANSALDPKSVEPLPMPNSEPKDD
jgi:hypothetical protein